MVESTRQRASPGFSAFSAKLNKLSARNESHMDRDNGLLWRVHFS